MADETATQSLTADETNSDKSLLEVIVIQAERDDTTLKEATRSVVVFTEDQLRLGTDRTMTDVFQRVPNVTTDPLFYRPIYRGIAYGGIAGFMPTSASYIDGYYTPSAPNLWDARQVEVQRGSENFVTGGTMGGVDVTTTNDPTEAPEGRALLSWAPDSEERQLGFAYGGPLSSELGYRVSAYGRATDGFTTNSTIGAHDWNSADEYMARLKLVWHPFDEADTVVRLRAEARKVSIDGDKDVQAPNATFDPFDRTDFSNSPSRDQDELRSVYIEVDHRFDDRWRLEGYVGVIEQHLRAEFDGENRAEQNGTVSFRQDRDYAIVQGRAFYDAGSWSAFARQYFVYLDLTNAYQDIIFDPVNDLAALGAPPTSRRVHSAGSTPDWWFIGTQIGARRAFGRFDVAASLMRSGQVLHANRSIATTRASSTGDPFWDGIYDNYFANVYYGLFPNVPWWPSANVDGDLNDFNYLPSTDAAYVVSDDVTIGAKYERSTRLAGISFNRFHGTLNTYDDEISDGYEVFVRSAALDGRLTVRANVFFTSIRDQQVEARLSEERNDREIVNAQRSHNDGVEIESTWTDGGLSVWLSLGLLHAEFDKVDVGDVDLSGNDFPNAPSWTVSAGCIYAHSSGLFVETDVTSRPETRAELDNNPLIVNDARTLVNARLGYTFRATEVSLYARNLFDEEYLDYRNTSGLFYVPGDPREIGMSVSVAL